MVKFYLDIMDVIPKEDIGSLGMGSIGLIFLLAANCNDIFFKCVYFVIGLVFLCFCLFHFYKTKIKNKELSIPLIPCKKRCKRTSAWICKRDEGLLLGGVVSIFVLISIKFSWIPIFTVLLSFDKSICLIASILCAIVTIIHGTLRRKHISIVAPDGWAVFFTGFITGLGMLFFYLFLI